MDADTNVRNMATDLQDTALLDEHPVKLSQQLRPSTESWGWSWDDCTKVRTLVRTTPTVASQTCLELVKCSYKNIKGCSTR